MFGLKKLFGGNKNQSESSSSKDKKNGKFFMELDESDDQLSKAVDAVTSTVSDVSSQVGGATSQAVGTVTTAVSNIVEDIKPGQSEDKAQPVQTAPAKQKATAKPPKSASQQKSKSRKKTDAPTPPAQVLQEKIPTSVESVPTESNGKATTFAPKYLMPTTAQPRRRPGPSMAMFKDMARQVKTK